MDTIEPTSILEIITIPFHIIRPIDSNGCQNWLPHENRYVVFTNKILNTATMTERNYQLCQVDKCRLEIRTAWTGQK